MYDQIFAYNGTKTLLGKNIKSKRSIWTTAALNYEFLSQYNHEQPRKGILIKHIVLYYN